jgi:DMSO reductase anchor subunit
MHPAFSVIFFTTLSGAGYGLWFCWGVIAAAGTDLPRTPALLALALGFLLVVGGLLSSLLHLGRPRRAWRALSQWRSSWLSREGVMAMAGFVPMLGSMAAVWFGHDPTFAGAALAVLSMATVVCTAMIYASLKPIPAWRHAGVVPVYVLFALFTGGLALAALWSGLDFGVDASVGLTATLAAFALWAMKWRYWRAIDRNGLPQRRASALGLPANRVVKTFERPHTEANYLTREMGFVLARKHVRKLRIIAVVLFCWVPVLCVLPTWLLPHAIQGPWFCAAALSAWAGAVVERWLFFAEAKHLVTLYY